MANTGLNTLTAGRVLKVRDYIGEESLLTYGDGVSDVDIPKLIEFRSQKLGILDIVLELNDDTKVSVELQVRRQKHWVKKQLFYLARMYEEDLRIGQNYGKLKQCTSICILDFRLLEGESYHSVYRLRDEKGEELTGLWEIHIIELGKGLQGSAVDDWIRLFNAKSKEELDMLAAKNKGLAEAAETIKRMSLGKTLRYWYEARLKAIRD